jgi:hypothetical protein
MWNEPIEEDSSDEEQSEGEEDSEEENDEPKTPTEETMKPKQNSSKKKQVEITTPLTDKEILKTLWKDTHKSQDKLFFIRRHETGRDLAEWHLVQVDEEETNRTKARRYGEYHIRYFIKKDADAKKKKTRACQFWPLLWELLRDGYLGAIIQVKPTRVDKFLQEQPTKYIWYQDTINLADTMILGPFEFSNKLQYSIPEEQWKELLEKAEDYRVDASDINRTVPLPQHKTNTAKKRKR